MRLPEGHIGPSDVVWMEKKIEKKFGENKAFTQYVKAILGIMIVLIIIVSVAVPVVQAALTSANLTGPAKTISDLYPLFMVLVGLILLVGVMA